MTYEGVGMSEVAEPDRLAHEGAWDALPYGAVPPTPDAACSTRSSP